jgi:hypothetical protein
LPSDRVPDRCLEMVRVRVAVGVATLAITAVAVGATRSAPPPFVASCPVSTEPSPNLPSAVVAAQGRRWIGSRVLYARTQTRDYGGFWEAPSRTYHRQIGWYRQRAGKIAITGKRRGSTKSSPPLITAAWTSYPTPGVLPSTLLFKQQGCWDVTARLGRDSVTITIAVYDTPRPS